MIFCLVLMLTTGLAPAQARSSLWKYSGKVRAPQEQFAAIPLPPRSLDHCDKSDLSDMRLKDMRGIELPYAVVFEAEQRSETERAGTALNRELPDASTSRLTVDFGEAVTKNRILVETEGSNFRRRLRVEGGDDLRNWATLLPEGWVLAAGITAERRFETVDIGLNTYRYIRVSVSKMPEEREAPSITRVACLHEVVKRPAEYSIKGNLLSYATNPQGTSVADVDLGSRNLPVKRLELFLTRAPSRVFEKRCSISGRNTLQHVERVRFETEEYGKERTVETPWEHIGAGVVYRNAEGTESLQIPVQSSFRYVRIEIDNQGGPPLELSGVTGYAVPAYVVFEPAGQSEFVLQAGNPDAPVPKYDSSKFLASLDSRTLSRCPPVEFESFSAPRSPKSPPGQRLVLVVLAIVIAFTLLILWRTARNLGNRTPPPHDTSAKQA